MKKLVLGIAAFCLSLSAVNAQNGAITKAQAAAEKGELAIAKEQIELAMQHEKTKDKGKTWYYRGVVYHAIAISETPEAKALSEDPLKETLLSYAKVKELEKENSTFYVFTNQKLDELYSKYFNGGIGFYNDGKYSEATDQFGKANLVLPTDTSSALNAFQCSLQEDNKEAVTKLYGQKLLDLKYNKPFIFSTLATIAEKEKNMDEAFKLLKAGKEANPGDLGLLLTECNFFIKTGKTKEAIAGIEEALKAEPTNHGLYFNLGILYENIENIDKAEEAYKKAVELSPNNYDYLFNYGAMFLNTGVKVKKPYDALDYKEVDKPENKKMLENANAYFKKAVPVLEAALKIKDNDRQLLNALMGIYGQLKENDKADKILDLLDKLPADGK